MGFDDLSPSELATLRVIERYARQDALPPEDILVLYLHGFIDRHSAVWFVTDAGRDALREVKHAA